VERKICRKRYINHSAARGRNGRSLKMESLIQRWVWKWNISYLIEFQFLILNQRHLCFSLLRLWLSFLFFLLQSPWCECATKCEDDDQK
jgi:hypothetical protein